MSNVRFGVHLNPYSSFEGLDEIRQYVAHAEAVGFAYVLVPEHAIFGLEQERQMGPTWWDAVTLATHLCSITERVRFMFSVVVLPHHNPIRLAKQLATLDHVSGGRIDLGIGVGWLEEEFDALGVPFAARGQRVDEYLDVLRALWTTHPSTHHGRLFDFDEMSAFPKPLQDPLPVWIGGSVAKSVGRTAARGDGWLPMGAEPEVLADGIARLRVALSEAGRDPQGFPIMGRMPFWEAGERATEHALEAGASRLVYLNGDLDRARSRLEEAEAMGVTHMYVELPVDSTRRLEQMSRFAEEFIARDEVSGACAPSTREEYA